MENLVSCQGVNCNLCSFFETITRLFNYLLEISFAVAVVVLIIAGFSYLGSVGNKTRLNRSRFLIKAGIFGFTLVLLGWLAIQTTVRIIGFKNAGSWWQFQCAITDDQPKNSPSVAANNQTSKKASLKSPFDDLKTFSDLNEFLESKEKKGKIAGPGSAAAFSNQVKNLPEGKTLKFLAPAKLNLEATSQDVYLSYLEIGREGENIKLESAGEYWDLVQNSITGLDQAANLPPAANELAKQLSDDANVGNLAVVNQAGEIVPLEQQANFFAPLLADINKANQFKSLKAVQLDLFSNDSNNNLDESWNSLGELLIKIINGSERQANYIELSNLLASIITDLIKAFSGGTVVEIGDAAESFPNINTGTNVDTTVPAEQPSASFPAANNNSVLSSSLDSDNDEIPDYEDACPWTPAEHLGDVNQDKGAPALYGCSCYDLNNQFKDCPEDACQGQYWVTYPHDKRDCSKGHLLPYYCQPLAVTFNPECPGLSDKSTTVATETHDDRGIPYGEGTQFYSTEPSPDSPESVKQALRFIYQYDPLRYEMIFRYADKIIDIRDPNKKNTYDGFTTDGAGAIFIDYSLPVDQLALTLLHETTHSAHMYLYEEAASDAGKMERVANANELGSICRAPGHVDMSEFPGQTKTLLYQGKDVRGFTSRLLQKVNPQSGYLGTAGLYQAVGYASDFGPLLLGPYHYGDDTAGMVIGLTEEEENIVKKIMENKEECLSRPPDDLPRVPACENIDRTLKIGGYDWYEY